MTNLVTRRWVATGRSALALTAVLLLAACASTGGGSTGLEVTEKHRGLFPGYYYQSMPGRVEVTMQINPDMTYEFKQPLASNTIKTVKGTLKIESDTEARASRIRLEWIGRNVLKVRSPYGTSMETGSSAGSAQGFSGADFRMRRQ